MATRILLVDDHPLFLAGIHSFLATNKDIKVIGEARNGQEAIEMVKKIAPDIVIMDITMPELNGIEASKQILHLCPDTKILALSIHTGKQFVRDMLDAGAAGYLLKDAAADELMIAIEKLTKGEMYLSSAITRTALEKDIQKEQIIKTDILNTKLHRPPILNDQVLRTHIIQKLEKHIDKPFSLFSAPAGYGKSVTISQWLEVTQFPSTWISLDNEHNDLKIFLRYFHAAIEKIFPMVLKKLSHFMNSVELPPIKHLVKSIINDLDEIEQNFIVVLDDFHCISELEIHEIVDHLLRFPPQHMHLVISTRRDPAINLPSLRVHNRINEFRIKDLGFKEEEIAKLYKNLMHVDLNEKTIKDLHKKTEGWITGLRLVSLTIQDGNEADQDIQILKHDPHILSEYLSNEILDNQPVIFRDLMVKSSFFAFFCAELLDDTINRISDNKEDNITGSEFINWLIESNLFIIALDDKNKWFRYHHLFRDLLKQSLDKKLKGNEILQYYKLSAEWFMKNNYIDEALENWISAEDIDRSVRLIEEHRDELMNTGQWDRLRLWLAKIPQEVLKQEPNLLTARAFLCDYRGEINDQFFKSISLAKALLESPLPHHTPELIKITRGELAVLDGLIHILTGEGKKVIDNANLALDLVPEDAYHIWSYAIGEKVVGYQIEGNVKKGIDSIDQLLNKRVLPPGLPEARISLWYCIAFTMEGDMVNVKPHALQCIELGEKYGLKESRVFGYYFMGLSHYLKNELIEAEAYLIKVVDNPFDGRPSYQVQCAFLLSAIYTDQGDEEKACKIVEDIISHTNNSKDGVAAATALAFQKERKVINGSIDPLDAINNPTEYELLPPLWFFYVPQLTPVKILLADNSPKSLSEAIALTEKLEIGLRKVNRKFALVDALALKALALNSQGNEQKAITALTESLEMALPGGMIRNFLDMGEAMIDLIKKILSPSLVDFTSQIIIASDQEKQLRRQNISAKTPKSSAGDDFEKISVRQLEILNLVAEGLRNKEIAERLYVSTDTVKKHLYHIFQKFDVNNRIALISKAKEDGLIIED